MADDLSTNTQNLPTEARNSGWLRGGQVMQIKPPAFAVEGILPSKSMSLLCGHPGSGKSFIALDMGLCIATGKPWLGRYPVQKGGVVYVAGEGFSGLGKRLRAWSGYYGYKPDQLDRFMAVDEAMDIRDPDVIMRLAEQSQRKFPSDPVRLICLDTLARCTPGAAESWTKHMNQVVAGCNRLQVLLGATILIVHHMDKRGKGPRGSNALMGAVDVAYRTDKHPTKSLVVLTCDKAKDIEEPQPIRLDKNEIDIPEMEATSLVLTLNQQDDQDLNQNEVLLLDALKALTIRSGAPYPEGASAGAWARSADDVGIGKTPFYATMKRLVTSGRVQALGTPHRPDRRYRLAEPQSLVA
jgi:hypothetical protein